MNPDCIERLIDLPAQSGLGAPGFGLLAEPAPGRPRSRIGMVVLVGGPQYRVGAHRHFVQMARRVAAAGVPVLRFDHRGIGDALAPLQGFENLDADVQAGIDALLQACPDLEGVVLWGLCDAASAALLYQARRNDARVRGLALLNPWVRSPQGQAQARVKHYYAQRLRSPEFWRKLLGGGVGLKALRGWLQARRDARAAGPATRQDPFQQTMAAGWQGFAGPILVQLSGRDQTAREFEDVAAVFPVWGDWRAHPRLQRQHYPLADHTLSEIAQQAQADADLLAWLQAGWPACPEN